MAEPLPQTDSDLREQIRSELEAEHEARLQRFTEKRQAARARTTQRRDRKARRAAEELRHAERMAFYKEKGYREYVDSNGRREWVTPQEYDWRMKRRRKRDKNREYRPSLARRRQELVLYGLAALIAVALGLLLIG